ncbi:winged helix-turn-helix domain-containing protein [Maricaulis parjimensis]|uniref:winged helix-turn-helix domain-containing protein n=1 Tax=Maricaulis parjimensis TaxID=144023 RepID=UPI00193A6EDD|nr:winged helix-turn-helix domain-containing protein [Maricaulis parjimensis]
MPPTLCAAELRLDTTRRQAWLGEQDITLSDLSFRVLACLAGAAPEAVSLAELKRVAWGLEVSDDAVKQRIKLLRRALEEAGANGLLATDRGRGYRLTQPAIFADTPAPASPKEIRTPRRHGAAIAAGLVISLLVIALAGWRLWPEADDGLSRVAVMPFSSGSDEADWLASGLELELASAIARIDGFEAVSRTSSHALAERRARTLHRELGADVLLDGHISQDETGYRVRVQLVDTRDETQIWSSQYSLPETGLNTVLADIATHIALIVHGTRGSGLYERMLAGPTGNIDAYEEYIMARAYLDRASPAHLEIAEAHFRAAIAQDPEFAMARAWLAYTLTRQEGAERGPAALDEANRALQLQPGLEEAVLARAEALAMTGDTRQADRLRREVRQTMPYLADFMSVRR